MAKLGISTGTTPNDGLGDNLLAGAVKINSNFSEIYTQFGDGTNLTAIGGTWTSTSAGIHTLKNVGIGTTNPRFTLEVGAVGASGTTLFVNGDARVTGIVTIGPASITLNGISNIINVGSGVTINGSTGTINATSINLGGTTLTGAAVTSITAGSGISVDQSTGNVTITATGGGGSSQWVTTAAGIHTLSNVGIGTTNPTSALTVSGNVSISGVSTFNNKSIYRGSGSHIELGYQGGLETNQIRIWGGNASDDYLQLYADANEAYIRNTGTNATNININATGSVVIGGGGSSSYSIYANSDGSASLLMWPYEKLRTIGAGITVTGTTFTNQLNVSGISTTLSLNVGTGGTVITTTTAGLVGIGTTNPTSALTVTGNALVTGIATITGVATINGINISAGNNDSNTGVGKESLLSVSGQENTAFGRSALFSTLGGQSNTGIGYQALYTSAGTTPDSSYNTALGWKAMRLNTTGSQNVAVGGQALESNLSGSGNVALGQAANNANTTANYNTSVGWGALAANTTGSYNIAIGFSAGWIGPISGNHNVLIGPVEINNSSSPTAAPPIAGGSNQLVIGAGSTAWIYGNSSYNIGIGTTNPTEKLTVVGVTSSTLFYGDASYTTSGRWILGADGTSNYTFVGIGFTQTTNDPVLYLARGRVYEFVNNSGGSHPFQIRVSDGGAAYSDGVTNNSAASGVIRFEVPFNAPNTLYYQCTSHSGMGNTISVYPTTI
jgi:trimeric autotransporter adhesin